MKFIFDFTDKGDEARIGLITLIVVFTFIGLYSMIYAIVRYAIPIAPLYLLMIAYSTDRLLKKI